MRFTHLSVVARDADRLAEFYKRIFGCEDRRPRTTLSGKKVSRGNGVPNSEIYSIWLTLPSVETPFLAIHEYKETRERPSPCVNEPGYAHIAFEVEDIRAIRDEIIRAGGDDQGEITDFGTVDAPRLVVYMRDPEGNVIELEGF